MQTMMSYPTKLRLSLPQLLSKILDTVCRTIFISFEQYSLNLRLECLCFTSNLSCRFHVSEGEGHMTENCLHFLQVEDEQTVKFYNRSFSDSYIKESIPSDVDVFIIFYDTTKPETVTVYDNFIRVVALTERKVVRVVGIQPLSHKRSLKRKSLRSKSIGYRWGDNHQIVSASNSPEMVRRELYRSIGAELINGHAHTSFNDTNQVTECAIL